MQDRTPAWTRLNKECHALAAQLDMNHKLLSDIACQEFGVASWSKLGVPELTKVRNRLREEVFELNKLTENQQGEIFKLGYKELKKDAPWIRDFIKRQIGSRKPVQGLTRDEASKVITGMRAVAGI